MSTNGTPKTISYRTRWIALSALLAATLAAGVAARVTSPTDPTAPPVTVHAGIGETLEASVRLDRSSVLQGEDGRVRMELVLRGERGQGALPTRVPTDLVVVLDRSGSMSGEAIGVAKAAVAELVAQLGPEDRFALVSYASDVDVPVALEAATDGARRRWQNALATIRADGGTNMAAGLDRAHEIALAAHASGRSGRVVLLSDGHANQGDHSREGLQGRAARAVSQEYVLSSVGIGEGFDEGLMGALADAGTGNFYYVERLAALAGVFADELASARETVASAVQILLAPGAGVVIDGAGGYPLVHADGRTSFRPGALLAGQERRIWLSLRAPTGSAGSVDLGRVLVTYVDASGVKRELALGRLPALACVEREEDYYASFDDDTYRRATVEETLGALKERVARRLAAGDYDGAVADVESSIDEIETEQIRALGYADPASVSELQGLRSSVMAAPAPSEQNVLGKQLLQEGRDARRVGAKY